MSSSKRHFTAVVGSKEHGLYISASPSFAARKIVSKLCTSSKSKKVEFCVREITQGSKKKTYGPYLGKMKNNKVIVHLKKDKLNKIIKGGRVERFGIIEPTDFIQRQRNNLQFAVIRKNYFRKPYLFFSPITNPISNINYYKYVAYETFLFRKPIIKQIKNNNIEDVDNIMQIDLTTLENLQKFIHENDIFSKLKEKIRIIINEKKQGIDKLQNKQYTIRLKEIIKKKLPQQPANITPKQANASAKQQQANQQQNSLKIYNININNLDKDWLSLESKLHNLSIYNRSITTKPYHKRNNDNDIIIIKSNNIYYIFFIYEKIIYNKIPDKLVYRYVVYFKDSDVKFKKLNDDLSINFIDIQLINIEILLFLLNFLDKTLSKINKNKDQLNNTLTKINKNKDQLNNTLNNIRNFVLEEVNIKLKELYTTNNVNYKKINYSIFENMNNMSNTERLIKKGFFIQNLNTNNNNIVITKSDIRGKIWKMGDTTYIFFSPIQLLQFKTENAYYYNYCVYLHSGYVKFKKVYEDKESKIITEDIKIKNIESKDLYKLIDFIIYRKECEKYKTIFNTVIQFLLTEIKNIDEIDENDEIDVIDILKKLKEFFNKEKTEKQKNLPTFYKTINETLKKKLSPKI